jgi:hypothetical protein
MEAILFGLIFRYGEGYQIRDDSVLNDSHPTAYFGCEPYLFDVEVFL